LYFKYTISEWTIKGIGSRETGDFKTVRPRDCKTERPRDQETAFHPLNLLNLLNQFNQFNQFNLFNHLARSLSARHITCCDTMQLTAAGVWFTGKKCISYIPAFKPIEAAGFILQGLEDLGRINLFRPLTFADKDRSLV
jgi:hypothetical protein